MLDFQQRALNYISRFVLLVLPAVASTVIGGYIVTEWQLARSAKPALMQVVPATPTDEEHRLRREELAFMRDFIRDRATNPRVVEEVKPTGSPRIAHAPAVPAPKARPKEMASLAPPPPVFTSPRPEGGPQVIQQEAAKNQQPETAKQQSVMLQPIVILPPTGPQPPATVGTAPERVAGTEPAKPGILSTIGSTVSVATGKAANATGDAVNWVIDLPGRVYEKGKSLVVGEPSPAAPGAQLTRTSW